MARFSSHHPTARKIPMTSQRRKTRPRTALVVRRARSNLPIADNGPMSVFERLARDNSITVEKLQGLITLQKEILAVQAKAAFTQAFAVMQGQLPVITKRGIIRNKVGAVQSVFAKLEDIQDRIKPILQAHGFTLRHRTEYPTPEIIRVVGILGHIGGHVEESTFEGPPDHSDYRTQIQSMGSTVTYGRRYTTIDLLNLTQRGLDDDGQSGVRGRPQPFESTPRHANDPISDGQRRRFWVLIRNAGRSEQDVKGWLRLRYGWESTKQITKSEYDSICAAVEAPGPLPLSDERQPGEEG